jgi:GAF domain-containing protein
MAFQNLSDQELIAAAQDLRRRALQGSGPLAEASRHEAELRRRLIVVDPLAAPLMPSSTGGLVESDIDLPALSAITSKFIIATADATTQSDGALRDLLHNVRVLLEMDIAFVAEFVAGQKVFRQLDCAEDEKLPVKEGDCAPLETTLCQRVVDGRLPELLNDAKSVPELWDLKIAKTLNIRAYLSTPVVLRCGTVYGTLCCISHSARSALGNKQIDALRHVAKIVGAELDKRSA